MGLHMAMYYSINEVCKLCGISRKQLLYFEKCGILDEVDRNKENNYRRYSQEQIYAIVAAKALKTIDIPLSEIKDIIYGQHIGSLQSSLRQQIYTTREQMDKSIRRYEESNALYAKFTEALNYLKLGTQGNYSFEYEIVEHHPQDVVMMSYASTFEDEVGNDIVHLPRIQQIGENVNRSSISSLIYLTYDHFDSERCTFDGKSHSYKIAIPVLDRQRPCAYYGTIPYFRGVSAIHIGSPKNYRLYHTYMGLLQWAREQGLQLENWSMEEWLISPMVTNNKDLWVIRVLIPLKAE